MAKTQWILLLSTCLVSTASVIFYIIAFLTENWVVAEAHNAGALQNSRIQYGLFTGHVTRHLLASESHYRLQVVCSYGTDDGDGDAISACMFSCQLTAEQRTEELLALLAGRSAVRECMAISGGRAATSLLSAQLDEPAAKTMIRTADVPAASIPPGFWVAAVSFMSLGCTFALVSSGFAALNIFHSPVEPIWGVLGLYIWNGVAAACAALVLIVWGALFCVRLSSNVAVTDTLVAGAGAYVSDGLAAMGYSYWLLLAPVCFHALNCGLLAWRTRIIEAEPKQPTFLVEAKQDFTNMWF